ncbi:hypothetical protein QQ045_026944 [Rhodiola kirilowii]
MEGVAATAYASLKAYWCRKDYRRLTATKHIDDAATATLGSQQPSKARRFKIRRGRLKLGRFGFIRLCSVRKLFQRMRDAYMNLVLSAASKGIFSVGYGGSGRLRKEYDETMLVEIYKRIVLAQQGRLAQKIGSEEVAPVCFFR